MKRLIRSASLTNYAEVARAAGLDARRMLREFKLPQAALHEIELKIPIESVRSLLEASAQRSGVEAFGLQMAEKRRLSNLGPLGILMREQPTMRQALEALAHYANRMNEALLLTIEDLRPLIEGRPAGQLAVRLFPDHPGSVPAGAFPADWLPAA